MDKILPLDHLEPLLCPAAGQINLSTWHCFVPCGCRHKSDMRAMCYICSLVLWVLMKRKAEPVLCQNIAPLLPSSPLPPGSGHAHLHVKWCFCYGLCLRFICFLGWLFWSIWNLSLLHASVKYVLFALLYVFKSSSYSDLLTGSICAQKT